MICLRITARIINCPKGTAARAKPADTQRSGANSVREIHDGEAPAGGYVNREYKSNLFAWIFSDREAALSLYNSMNGTFYSDPDALEFTTLENVIYMGMKNDVSFLVGSDMNLYEHQSTWNPNMPLRGLFYFAEVYKGYVASRNLDIYSSAKLRIPAPKYVIFYNGTKEEPESMELRLSELYGVSSADGPDGVPHQTQSGGDECDPGRI